MNAVNYITLSAEHLELLTDALEIVDPDTQRGHERLHPEYAA